MVGPMVGVKRHDQYQDENYTGYVQLLANAVKNDIPLALNSITLMVTLATHC